MTVLFGAQLLLLLLLLPNILLPFPLCFSLRFCRRRKERDRDRLNTKRLMCMRGAIVSESRPGREKLSTWSRRRERVPENATAARNFHPKTTFNLLLSSLHLAGGCDRIRHARRQSTSIVWRSTGRFQTEKQKNKKLKKNKRRRRSSSSRSYTESLFGAGQQRTRREINSR